MQTLLFVLCCVCFMRAHGMDDLAHVLTNTSTNSTISWCNDHGNPGILAVCIIYFTLAGGYAVLAGPILLYFLFCACAVGILTPTILPPLLCLVFCGLPDKRRFIHFAARHNWLSLMQLLRGFTADRCGLCEFSEHWRGHTPLGLASMNGHFAMVKYLVEQCEVNGQEQYKNGNTALHLALLGEQTNKHAAYIKIAQYLIQKCPTRLTDTNNAGVTPMDLILKHYRGSLLVPTIAKTSPFYRTAFEGDMTGLNTLLLHTEQNPVRDGYIKKLLPQKTEKFLAQNLKRQLKNQKCDIKIYFKTKELWS